MTATDYLQHYDQQDRVVENPVLDNKHEYLLVEWDRSYSGVSIDRVSSIHSTLEEAVGIADGKFRKLLSPLPKRTWITTLSDYSSEDGLGRSSKTNQKCRNYQELIAKTLEIVKNFDTQKFLEECGDGYHIGFYPDDGSVRPGYRLQYRALLGWHELDISAIHVYQGK